MAAVDKERKRRNPRTTRRAAHFKVLAAFTVDVEFHHRRSHADGFTDQVRHFGAGRKHWFSRQVGGQTVSSVLRYESRSKIHHLRLVNDKRHARNTVRRAQRYAVFRKHARQGPSPRMGKNCAKAEQTLQYFQPVCEAPGCPDSTKGP